jgi:hypothetical protein
MHILFDFTYRMYYNMNVWLRGRSIQVGVKLCRKTRFHLQGNQNRKLPVSADENL